MLIPFVGPDVLKGMIIEWYGAIVDIPSGFALCDGNNGTPDLRNRMVIGAGDTYAVGASGGTLTHTHTVNQAAHTHTIGAGADILEGTNYSDTSDSTDPDITCSTDNHLNPYHALAYIMKL